MCGSARVNHLYMWFHFHPTHGQDDGEENS